jgi:hypothetical protein
VDLLKVEPREVPEGWYNDLHMNNASPVDFLQDSRWSIPQLSIMQPELFNASLKNETNDLSDARLIRHGNDTVNHAFRIQHEAKRSHIFTLSNSSGVNKVKANK